MSSDPHNAKCHTTYMPAAKSSGTRPASAIKHIVLHSTESSASAASIASYFHGSNAGGSTHLVVDVNQCQRCLPNGAVPWGATGANTDGLHIEHCGFAAWPRRQWMLRIKMLRRSAYKSAVWCKRYGIPVRYVTAPQLKAGASGITTHDQVSKAFPGSGHWDPGAGFPIWAYIQMVKYYKARLK